MRPWLLLSALVVTALLMAPLAAAPKPPGAGPKPPPPPPPPPPPADPAIAYIDVALEVMNANGSTATTVYTGSATYPTWAPDRGAIAVSAYSGYGFDLWRIDVIVSNGTVQGTNPLLLYANVSHAAGFRPAWSPDGTVIAFIEERVDFWGDFRPQLLCTIPASGGAPTTLYAVESWEGALVAMQLFSPTWNAAGTRIAWVENHLELSDYLAEYNEWSLMVLDLATNEVTTGFGPVNYSFDDLDWARTQDRVAFHSSPGGGRASVYTIDLGQPNPIPQFVVWGWFPTWLPDDAKIAFAALQVVQISGPGKSGKTYQSYIMSVWTYEFSTGQQVVVGPGSQPDWVRCSPCP